MTKNSKTVKTSFVVLLVLQVQDTDTVGDLVSVSLVGWLSCKSVCDFPVCAARREAVGRVRLCSKTRNSNVTRVNTDVQTV